MQPLARHDVVIGQPLAFSIFDGKGKLLLAQGQVVRSEIQPARIALWTAVSVTPRCRAYARIEMPIGMTSGPFNHLFVIPPDSAWLYSEAARSLVHQQPHPRTRTCKRLANPS
jgi:hypothetical protein